MKKRKKAKTVPALGQVAAMAEIRLSIVIPNYNKGERVAKLLSQLLEQCGDLPVQLVVVDDCSTDNSVELIRATGLLDYHDQWFCENHINLWVTTARNQGLELSRGKYVTFLDSDDEVKPYYIKRLLELCNQCDEEQLDFVFFDYEAKNVRDDQPLSKEQGHNQMVWSKMFRMQMLLDNEIRFNEEVYKHNILGEDGDFCYQVLSCTENGIKIDEELVIYNWGVKDSVSNSRQKFGKETVPYEWLKANEHWFNSVNQK